MNINAKSVAEARKFQKYLAQMRVDFDMWAFEEALAAATHLGQLMATLSDEEKAMIVNRIVKIAVPE